MPNTLFNRKVSIRVRLFTSFLIIALAPSALGYAQQPQRRPRAPQPRILIEEATKANTAEPAGQRAARPELALQTGVSRFASNVVFSPDGRLLASMDYVAGSIKLWGGYDWARIVHDQSGNAQPDCERRQFALCLQP